MADRAWLDCFWNQTKPCQRESVCLWNTEFRLATAVRKHGGYARNSTLNEVEMNEFQIEKQQHRVTVMTQKTAQLRR